MTKPVNRPYIVLPPGQFGYRGVRKHQGKRKKPFYARVKYKNEEIYTPTFEMPHQAAVAYDVIAEILHGEKAVLNFPQGPQK